MKRERDALMSKALPVLRHRCAELGMSINFVDLRWGITSEQVESGQTLRSCLLEIDRCRPYFVALLGDRYGWAQHADMPRDAVLARTLALAAADVGFEWLTSLADRSMTELEIEHAVLRRASPSSSSRSSSTIATTPHACVLLRTTTTTSTHHSSSTSTHDADDSPLAQSKLDSLKQRLHNVAAERHDAPLALFEYRTADDVASLVVESLWTAIKADLPMALRARADAVRTRANTASSSSSTTVVPSSTESSTSDVLTVEREAQRAFGALRLRDAVINDAELAALDEFVDAGDDIDIDSSAGSGNHDNATTLRARVLLVTGVRGCGKSTLLVNWCERRWHEMSNSDEQHRTLLFVHHFGCTPAGRLEEINLFYLKYLICSLL